MSSFFIYMLALLPVFSGCYEVSLLIYSLKISGNVLEKMLTFYFKIFFILRFSFIKYMAIFVSRSLMVFIFSSSGMALIKKINLFTVWRLSLIFSLIFFKLDFKSFHELVRRVFQFQLPYVLDKERHLEWNHC